MTCKYVAFATNIYKFFSSFEGMSDGSSGNEWEIIDKFRYSVRNAEKKGCSEKCVINFFMEYEIIFNLIHRLIRYDAAYTRYAL